MVIVDTSVWVQFFRTAGSREHLEVQRLVREGEALVPGAVLAEILQGARTQEEFAWLRDRLAVLPYISETRETWTRVGELSFELRQRGRGVALVDLLIAALALEHEHELYTLDEHFQRVPGLKLHAPEAA